MNEGMFGIASADWLSHTNPQPDSRAHPHGTIAPLLLPKPRSPLRAALAPQHHLAEVRPLLHRLGVNRQRAPRCRPLGCRRLGGALALDCGGVHMVRLDAATLPYLAQPSSTLHQASAAPCCISRREQEGTLRAHRTHPRAAPRRTAAAAARSPGWRAAAARRSAPAPRSFQRRLRTGG